VTSHYQLPDDITCERCILQMIYYTGNACHHPGYEEFSHSSWPGCAPNKEDWITLDPPLCGDGDHYPEEFWNCADIAITSDGRRPSSDDDGAVTPAPTDSDVEPTPQPLPSTPSPTTRDSEKPKMFTPNPTTPEGPSPTRSPQPDTPSPTRMPITRITSAPITRNDDDCDDPVSGWQQCGGSDWEGSTCCRPGYQCDRLARRYSQCRPQLDACSWHWEQCGGQEWDGPVCCSSGSVCKTRNMWYSQCDPEDPATSAIINPSK